MIERITFRAANLDECQNYRNLCEILWETRSLGAGAPPNLPGFSSTAWNNLPLKLTNYILFALSYRTCNFLFQVIYPFICLFIISLLNVSLFSFPGINDLFCKSFEATIFHSFGEDLTNCLVITH